MSWWDASEGFADLNRDGGIDGDDLILYFAWWGDSRGLEDSLADNRFGYRGYVWDDRLQLYHVRHRVYDPMPGPTGMRWLQRDPAMFVDGLNLYAYCQGDPVNGVDPYGLDTWLIGSILRVVGLPGLGDQVDDAVDGGAEIVDYWGSADSVDQIVEDASDPEARQEVHDALQRAKGVADQIPGGELAGHAVNIVDKGLGVWDEYVDGTNAANCGPGGSYISPAVDDLIESVAEGVVDRSKGKKTDAGTKSAVGDGPKKRGPKPKGEGPHNKKIEEEASKLKAEGNEILSGGGDREKVDRTPGGHKVSRRVDIKYKTPSGEVRGRQVGRSM